MLKKSQLPHYNHVAAPKNLRSETWETLEICCPRDRASLLLCLHTHHITVFTHSQDTKPEPYRYTGSLRAKQVVAWSLGLTKIPHNGPALAGAQNEALSTTETPSMVHITQKMTAEVHDIPRAKLIAGNVISTLLLGPLAPLGPVNKV